MLAAVLALAVAPEGFSVTDPAAKVQSLTGETEDGYTTRQAGYNLRKLRGKQLVIKPGRTRRDHVPEDAARLIAGLQTLREHVIAPVLTGLVRPGSGRHPASWTRVDQDYQTLRIDMNTLLQDLGIQTAAA